MKAESHRHNVLFTHPSLAAEPATPQPQFSIVGEKGAGNLDAVDKGERIKNRDIAEEMEREGKSARAIRLAT
ncbi:MAG: hypothetical protein IK092_06105, partial [Muribaculaceae bacterium]|nr:hypothetical protein [Muribaculaceae bacterium]